MNSKSLSKKGKKEKGSFKKLSGVIEKRKVSLSKKVNNLIKRSQRKCSNVKPSSLSRKGDKKDSSKKVEKKRGSLKGVSIKKPVNIILDLDNTLINSLETEEFNKLSEKQKDKLMSLYNYKWMGKDYIVFSRPGLDEFLDYLFENFKVSIWTAASKDYMSFIVKNIILSSHKERNLDMVLYDKMCNFSKTNFTSIKDLRYLSELNPTVYRKDNTFLIDDLKEIYENDKKHVIHIKSFDVMKKGAEKDKVLEKMKEKLKKIRERVEKKVRKASSSKKR